MGRIVAAGLTVAVAAIVAIVVVGPGKDRPEAVAKGAPANESTRVSPASVQGRRATAAPGAHVGATVRMSSLRFHPAVVRVRVGEAVRFLNRDDVAHSVSEDVGARSGLIPAFDSDRIPPGGSFTYVTTAAGTIPYVCTLHPTVMTGRIVVTRS